MAEVQTQTPGGPATQVVVTGQPLAQTEAQPERAEVGRLEEIRAFEAGETSLAQRVADSDLEYVDDNAANRHYIRKVPAEGEVVTKLGTPELQVRRIPFPADDALAGVQVLREDGTFYSIPAGVRNLGEVVDPDSGEPLVGKIDPKRAKNRLEAAGLGDLRLKSDGTVEQKSTMTAPKHLATASKGNKKSGSKRSRK